MSIRDFEKTLYKTEFLCYNLAQLKKIIKKVEEDYKSVNAGTFKAHLEIEYNDRDSEL